MHLQMTARKNVSDSCVRAVQELQDVEHITLEIFAERTDTVPENRVVYCNRTPSSTVGANSTFLIPGLENTSGEGIFQVNLALVVTVAVLVAVIVAIATSCAFYMRKIQRKWKSEAPGRSECYDRYSPPASQVVPPEEQVIGPSIASDIDSTSAHLAREETLTPQLTAPTERISGAHDDIAAPAAGPSTGAEYENESYGLSSSESKLESTVASAAEVLSSWSSIERNREPPRVATRGTETPHFRKGAFKPSHTGKDEKRAMQAMKELVTQRTIMNLPGNRSIEVNKICDYLTTGMRL